MRWDNLQKCSSACATLIFPSEKNTTENVKMLEFLTEKSRGVNEGQVNVARD